MKKTLLCIFSCLLTVSLMQPVHAQHAAGTEQPPKREFRGAWIHTVGNSTWRNMTSDEIKEDIIRLLDTFKSVNINAVLFQVRPQADALFVSQYEPWSRFITGTQGKAPVPFFDPAEFVIEECHKRGMEMHAWFNPYRVTSNDQEELAPDHLYYKKPHLFVKYGTQIYFDPGEPESREHTLQVISDFVRRYDVDAVHFDDYFYPYRIGREEFPDEASFLKYHEQDGFSRWDKLNWRRNNVDVLVKELNDTIKSIKPWVKFGISPFGVWRNKADDPEGSDSRAGQTNYDDLFADIRLWCKEGWIDYNVPQLYWGIGHALANYEPLIKWWSENNYGVHLYIGQSIGAMFDVKRADGVVEDQLYKKMEMVRTDPKVLGNIWWSGIGLARNERMLDSLRLDYQKYPALLPLYTHMDTTPPAPVSNLKASGGRLTWLTKKEENIMDRPYYFAIYRFLPNEPVNIDDATKLLDIVQGNSFEIPVAGRRYKYVVTALDRLQNESVPSKAVTVNR